MTGPGSFDSTTKPKSRLSTRQQFLAYGATVLLVAGCCAGGGILALRGGDKKAADAAGPVRSASPAPVTAGQYAVLLVAADKAIGADFRRLATNDRAAYAAAAPKAAQTLRDQAAKLRGVQPPASATAAGPLTAELDGLADEVAGVATHSDTPACPAAATSRYVSLLASGSADRIHEDAQILAKADPTYVFGAFLPAPPKVPTSRPANGAFIKKATRHGSGKLKIKNGGGDTTVSLVPVKGTKKPVFTVYVRARSTYTVSRVSSGDYSVYYATGAGWNPVRKGFTSNCGFNRFDDAFRFSEYPISTTWEITMTPVAGGNASTSDVDPDAFPSD
jgi:hypothetical protein